MNIDYHICPDCGVTFLCGSESCMEREAHCEDCFWARIEEFNQQQMGRLLLHNFLLQYVTPN